MMRIVAFIPAKPLPGCPARAGAAPPAAIPASGREGRGRLLQLQPGKLRSEAMMRIDDDLPHLLVAAHQPRGAAVGQLDKDYWLPVQQCPERGDRIAC